jgi:hypothetical protein
MSPRLCGNTSVKDSGIDRNLGTLPTAEFLATRGNVYWMPTHHTLKLTESLLVLLIVRQHLSHQSPEAGAVVQFAQVAELVHNNVITEARRQEEELVAKVEIP